ncbi:bacillithiol system redox-active protein YtxJ [Tenacibaculum sp. 190524A02b]|uniref:Bacillithiol system protein YtxJ n=1 Tax=Tenacibaculum vairaonense TaxID=3137860 RepID=A0ABM9PP60_9FLAO
MGIFKSLFGEGKKEENKKESYVNWIQLKSIEQLKEIDKLSNHEPIAIFKHSTRCGISRMVIQRFEEGFDEALKDFKVYYLDLLNYRELSNEIGYKYQVLHQSPQLLIIKKGVAIAYASHYDIASINLKSF